jgi:hypothetical protein
MPFRMKEMRSMSMKKAVLGVPGHVSKPDVHAIAEIAPLCDRYGIPGAERVAHAGNYQAA